MCRPSIPAELPKGLIAYACSCFNQLAYHQCVVAADNRGEMEDGFFCGSAVGNFLVLLIGIGRQDGLVLHDGFGCIGCAVSGKIVGGGKQDELDFGQRFDDQRRGGGFGNAQGEVEAFGNEVDMDGCRGRGQA